MKISVKTKEYSFTKVVVHANLFNDFRKKAFTLAEVLITLGVLGVVAAMTIPSVIQKQHNLSVENKLKKIYTTMNQAMRMSEIDNGERMYWHHTLYRRVGIEKYILPYIKYLKIAEDDEKTLIYLNDGSILASRKHDGAGVWEFYTMDIEKCQKNKHYIGICSFNFNSYADGKYYFETYNRRAEAADNTLKNASNYGCYTTGKYCSALIQKNGWKIPKDYPYKVR